MAASFMCGCTAAEKEQYLYIDICYRANGLSFEDIENKITIPIENVLDKVKSIHSISSASSVGRSHISVSFPLKVGHSLALNLIKEKLNTGNMEFPEMTSKPEIIVMNNHDSDSQFCS